MKNSIILVTFLVSTSFCRTIDSMGVFPFGPELDLRKDLTLEDVIKVFGMPNSIDTTYTNFYIHYPNKVCYFHKRRLYSIQIIKGKFQDLEIGMSKKKLRKVYGPCSIIDTLPNGELQEFGYYDDEWVRYIVTLFLKSKKLTKILIRRELPDGS